MMALNYMASAGTVTNAIYRTMTIMAATKPIRQRLAGKVAIVTASTEGVGLATARRLGEEGACVVLSGSREEKVKEAVAQLRAEGLTEVMGMKCYVSSSEDRKRLLDMTEIKFGGVDILVHCAGASAETVPAISTTSEECDKSFEVNVRTAQRFSQQVHPFMKEREGGSIVYLSSRGIYKSTGNKYDYREGQYTMGKLKLQGLCSDVARDVAEDNIRVNCVLHANAQALKSNLDGTPLRRIDTHEQVAHAVAFLASDEAAFITGENLALAN